MYFDRPGLILLVSLATLGPLAGLAVVKWLNHWKQPTGSDAWFSFLTLAALDLLNGLVISAWIAQMYDEYKDIKNGSGRPSIVNTPQPEQRRIANLGAVYEFQGQAVKIDHMSRKIKHHCIVLLNQRDHGFEIDLREQTWKAHFGGRDNWVWVRDVKMSGAYAKEASRTNSPFVVVNWRIVEEGAKGSLPH